jgi:hypothetical protein
MVGTPVESSPAPVTWKVSSGSHGGAELDVVTLESANVRHYFIGEKSVGRMYAESNFSTSLLACSDLMTS